MPEQPSERLHVFLAHAGIASRRRAEELILQGRVTVNGRVVTELGTKVTPERDDVRVDGQRVQRTAQRVYILLNKPTGVLSAMQDSRGRQCLGDLVQTRERLYPVGRLDVNSEGLVLLTDDGELANLLSHPSHGHEKEYRVLVNGTPSDETLATWRRGVVLEGERTAPAQVDVLRKEKDSTLLRVVMHEGRKRQIRNVAALLGHPVRELQRVRIGPLTLGTLKPGQWRRLTEAEVKDLLVQSRKGPQLTGGIALETRPGLPRGRRQQRERAAGKPFASPEGREKRPRPGEGRRESPRPRKSGEERRRERPASPPRQKGRRGGDR